MVAIRVNMLPGYRIEYVLICVFLSYRILMFERNYENRVILDEGFDVGFVLASVRIDQPPHQLSFETSAIQKPISVRLGAGRT